MPSISIPYGRAVKLLNLVKLNGVEDTAKKTNTQPASIKRYLYHIKQHYNLTPNDETIPNELPKVLVFDIETTPMEVFV